MNASTRRGRLLALFLAGVAILMAGCSTTSPPAGRKPTRGPASASRPVTTSSPSTPTTAAGPATCKSSALSVLLGHATKTAGTAYYPIVFQNLSATPCTLYGFPAVAFTGKNYTTRVGPAATRNQSSPERLVTIEPEGTARARIGVADANNYSSSCDQAAVDGLLIQPPSLTNSVRLPFTGVTCVNPGYRVLTVDAVVPGPALADGD
jgi:hypothetical protein